MQRSIYLAKLIGPIAVAIGLGLLFNMHVYRAMAEEFLTSHALIYLSGVGALAAGIAVLLAHNEWKGDWRLIITVFGWLAAIGGACRIIVPQFVERIGLHMIHDPAAPMIGGFVVLVIGGVLSYFGYADANSLPARKDSRRGQRKRRTP